MKHNTKLGPKANIRPSSSNTHLLVATKSSPRKAIYPTRENMLRYYEIRAPSFVQGIFNKRTNKT